MTTPQDASGGESSASRSAPIPTAQATGMGFSPAISSFWLNQSAPGAVTEVPDPAGGPEKVIKMTVSDQDVAPITPTENPRAQLLSPDTIEPGQEFWWSGRFFLPVEGFPAFIPQWLNIVEGAYGPPWNGTPPFEIEAVGSTLRWQRNGTYDWDIPWEMPLERGRWITYLVHEKLAAEGFIELWINGSQVDFFARSSHNPDRLGPTTRLNMKTLDGSNDGGPNFVVIQNYRKVGMFQSVTLYHGGMKLGSTRASVE
ncbi:MAG: heparin lyase I family protein [Actinobacteria bacterium]|nr:heparin lyase I family protein [Actinomycetota bacterium]